MAITAAHQGNSPGVAHPGSPKPALGPEQARAQSSPNITIALEALRDSARLEPDWQELQSRSEHSFFQSWGWIGCWLRQLPSNVEPMLLRASAAGTLVGLAILVGHRGRRRGVIRSRALHLNQTGDPDFDDLTIEHNGFLADRRFEATVRTACLSYLATELHAGCWDELYLAGVSPEVEPQAQALGLELVVLKRCLHHLVDLEAVRAKGGDYLACLGKKTRQHIRRSLRHYEAKGALSVTEAGSSDQALEAFETLVTDHQADWRARGLPGAFADPWIVAFHKALIEQRFEAGEVQLITIATGARRLGTLYHFRYAGRIYSYQWGLVPEPDLKVNYGLVCDYLAVQHNLNQGAAVFDFLHGDTLHKRRLGTATEERLWLVLQRARLDFRVENWLRSIKRRHLARATA